MTIIRARDEEPSAGAHSGKKFRNPKHEEMFAELMRQAPHLQN